MIVTCKKFIEANRSQQFVTAWSVCDNQIIISVMTIIKNAWTYTVYHVNLYNHTKQFIMSSCDKILDIQHHPEMSLHDDAHKIQAIKLLINDRWKIASIVRAPNPIPCECKISQIGNVVQLTPLNLHEFYKIPSVEQLMIRTIFYARMMDSMLLPEIKLLIIELTTYLWYSDLKTYAQHCVIDMKFEH